MRLSRQLQLVERIAGRHDAPEHRVTVCDRIEEPTTQFAMHPPTFAPAVEAGIIAAVEREFSADEQFCPVPMEDRS